MFRSGIELELLAQAKIDDFNALFDRPTVSATPSTSAFFTRVRRRFGLRLIAAGTRLVGAEPAVTLPAVAGR